jgi:hypothetical protein
LECTKRKVGLGSSFGLMVVSWIHNVNCINVILDLNQDSIVTKFQAY